MSSESEGRSDQPVGDSGAGGTEVDDGVGRTSRRRRRSYLNEKELVDVGERRSTEQEEVKRKRRTGPPILQVPPVALVNQHYHESNSPRLHRSGTQQ